jgi:hypothetical protein
LYIHKRFVIRKDSQCAKIIAKINNLCKKQVHEIGIEYDHPHNHGSN